MSKTRPKNAAKLPRTLLLPRRFGRGLFRGNRSEVGNGYAELFHKVCKLLAGTVRTVPRGVAVADLTDVAIAALLNLRRGRSAAVDAEQPVCGASKVVTDFYDRVRGGGCLVFFVTIPHLLFNADSLRYGSLRQAVSQFFQPLSDRHFTATQKNVITLLRDYTKMCYTTLVTRQRQAEV